MFGRKKKQAEAEPVEVEETALVDEEETADDTELVDDEEDATDAVAPVDEEDDEDLADKWDELDESKDWRDDGPFDFTEVDLSDDPIERLDLGALILTPREGFNLQLQVNETDHSVQAALVMGETSAMEIGLFAAPASGGLARQVRRTMMAAIQRDSGHAEFAEGPFGTELRAHIPVEGPEGHKGIQPTRAWFAEGPRWLLRGMIIGQAAMDDTDPVRGELEELFRDIVVKRGDSPMPPGDLITMTLPEQLRPQQS